MLKRLSQIVSYPNVFIVLIALFGIISNRIFISQNDSALFAEFALNKAELLTPLNAFILSTQPAVVVLLSKYPLHKAKDVLLIVHLLVSLLIGFVMFLFGNAYANNLWLLAAFPWVVLSASKKMLDIAVGAHKELVFRMSLALFVFIIILLFTRLPIALLALVYVLLTMPFSFWVLKDLSLIRFKFYHLRSILEFYAILKRYIQISIKSILPSFISGFLFLAIRQQFFQEYHGLSFSGVFEMSAALILMLQAVHLTYLNNVKLPSIVGKKIPIYDKSFLRHILIIIAIGGAVILFMEQLYLLFFGVSIATHSWFIFSFVLIEVFRGINYYMGIILFSRGSYLLPNIAETGYLLLVWLAILILPTETNLSFVIVSPLLSVLISFLFIWKLSRT